MTRPVLSAKRDRAMLNEVLKGRRDLADIAEGFGLDEAALARWSQDIDHHRPIAAISRMYDLQAQLTLSRYRTSAVLCLGELVLDREKQTDPKLKRQAAADLLKIDLKWVREGVTLTQSERSDELRAFIKCMNRTLNEPDDELTSKARFYGISTPDPGAAAAQKEA